jgi:tellurite resistance protein TehA-like permease
VHFHSAQCNFPEFPGCFYCDKTEPIYEIAVHFHFACSMFGGFLALLFISKLLVARRVVFDELSSPTTASPAGLICMTIAIVAAGRGLVGQVLVSLAASVHLCLVIWFIYMALAYQIMPDPSWFPNTVSIGLSAVKVWLYYPMCGHFLMAVSPNRPIHD